MTAPAGPPAFPATGRVVAVDHGSVRVGLAVCDPNRVLASPLATYERSTADRDAAYFAALTAAEDVAGYVVGLPRLLNGDEGEQARNCRRFGAWLAGVTGRPVAYWDERWTSSAADDAMLEAGLTKKKRKAKRDRVAAQLILEAFLAAGCPAGG